MATRLMNMQIFLSLNYVIPQLLNSYNDKVIQHQSTEVAIISS